MLAEDYLRMGIVKAQKSEPLEPVIGRRSARPSSSSAAASPGSRRRSKPRRAGYEVVLVEKAGAARRLRRRPEGALPERSAVHGPGDRAGSRSKVQQVSYHPKVKVFTSARIAEDRRAAGHVRRDHRNGGGQSDRRARRRHRAGHRLEALRRHEARAPRLRAQAGRGHQRRVREAGRRGAAQAPLGRPAGARASLFVQCAGSRDQAHLPYCSSVCCMATLKHAALRPRAEPRREGLRRLQGHAHAGPVRALLPARRRTTRASSCTKGEVTAVERGRRAASSVTAKDTLLGDGRQGRGRPGRAGHRHGPELGGRRSHPRLRGRQGRVAKGGLRDAAAPRPPRRVERAQGLRKGRRS